MIAMLVKKSSFICRRVLEDTEMQQWTNLYFERRERRAGGGFVP